jgi:hypothetical protein
VTLDVIATKLGIGHNAVQEMINVQEERSSCSMITLSFTLII